MLSPAARDSLISPGRPGLEARIRRDFARPVTPGVLQAVLRRLARPFDGLAVVCNLATLALLAYALARRDRGLLVLSGTPVVFALVHAALLLSFHRFMLPVYPITLACGIVAVRRLGGRNGRRPPS